MVIECATEGGTTEVIFISNTLSLIGVDNEENGDFKLGKGIKSE